MQEYEKLMKKYENLMKEYEKLMKEYEDKNIFTSETIIEINISLVYSWF